MSERKLVLYPAPVLTTPPAPVTDFGDDLKAIIKDMFRVLYATESGVGLAAVQVGVPLNLFVVDTAASNKVKKPEFHIEGKAFAACNAEIIHKEDLGQVQEGCLSFPEIYMPVTRARRVRMRAQDLDGNWFEADADDFEAQVIQHEADHCAGRICFDLAPRRYRRQLDSMIQDVKRRGKWKA